MLGIFKSKEAVKPRACRSREEELGSIAAPWELGQALDRLFASQTALAIVNLPVEEKALVGGSEE